MEKTKAYKEGYLTGIDDWKITGVPFRTRQCPYDGKDAHYWFLGRLEGFKEAESLLNRKKNNSKTLEE